jgi:hypothetical protein
MPYSNVEQISLIMGEILRIKPRRLIDVGCGLGVYGLLSRIQLDLYSDENFHRKLFRRLRPEQAEWETTIDAIEGFEDYVDYIPSWVYNHLIIEDVRTALPKIPDNHYDLGLALAVIEHLSKEDGLEFVRHLKRISRTIIISVPKNVRPQSVPGNDFETHRSQWSKEDFIKLGFNKFLLHSGAWIPVHDPGLPVYQASDSVKHCATPEKTSVLTENQFLIRKLDKLSEKVDQIIEMQQYLEKLMSFRYRFRSFFLRSRLSG